MAQGDEILGIERQRRFKNRLRFLELPRLVQRLPVHDVAAHVPGLLRQVLAADRDGLFHFARLAVLVRQRSEVPPRILLEFLAQFFYSSGARHGVF